MPEQTPETPPAPQVPSPDPTLMNAAIAANDRASRAEARAAYAEEVANRAAQTAANANRPTRVDPIDRLATEDVTLAPEQRKALLDAAIRGRAGAIAGKAVEMMREENSRREAAMESRLAMDSVMNARPELSQPEHAANYAASMTKAKFEMDAAGVQYSPAQLAQRAAIVYDSTFRPKAEKPPFVEGGANPNMGGLPQGTQVPQGKSYLESTYGMKEGQIQGHFDPNDADAIKNMNNEYVQSRNAPLLKAGAVTNMQEVLRGGEA